jgi:hypothetical protein
MRDLKKYKLRPARRAKVHALLSGVVHVCSREGVGYVNIQFEECFVDAVGKALPYGLHPSTPAFLKFLHMPGRKTWRLFAMYLGGPRGVLLWETPELPVWVINVKKR